MTSETPTYRLWRQLSRRPGGSRIFTAAAMARVPYFASIAPHVQRMEPGFAEVSIPKWFFVYNHLGPCMRSRPATRPSSPWGC